MKKILITQFFVEENGGRVLCQLEISDPQDSNEDDSYCDVKLSHLLDTEKRIYGIDSIQAQDLAIDFVVSLLSGKTVIDEGGSLIDSSNMKNYLDNLKSDYGK